MRPDQRELSPLERAKARTAALQANIQNLSETVDDFYIDPATIPEGWSYEWKRRTTLGLEDPSYNVQLAQSGWEAVPSDRHPEYMPVGYTDKNIERRGMVLMERPLEITNQIRARDKREAVSAVKSKEAQLNGDSVSLGKLEAKVNKSYEAIKIPE
jgi:hypothetical protein